MCFISRVAVYYDKDKSEEVSSFERVNRKQRQKNAKKETSGRTTDSREASKTLPDFLTDSTNFIQF